MVKKYFFYFRFLFLTLLVLGIIYAGLLIKNHAAPKQVRTNTECVTKNRVFDYGQILSEEEEAKLNSLIAKKQEETGCDIVLVVLNESLKEYAREKEPSAAYEEFVRVYAEDFYAGHKFGYERAGGDGILLLDNWYREDNGKVYSWILTAGRVKDRIKKERLEKVFDEVYKYVENHPYKAYEAYIRAFDKHMGNGIKGIIPGWLPPIGAGIAALVFIIAHLGKRKGRNTTVPVTYVNGGRPVIHKKEDIFINKVVTRRRIQRVDNSGGGRNGGGGGGSFGGGGRSR